MSSQFDIVPSEDPNSQLLRTLVLKLHGALGLASKYRDIFDIDLQYKIEKENTKRVPTSFHKEFQKINHHWQNIIDCLTAVRQIENDYTDMLDSYGNEFYELLDRHAKLKECCQKVAESATTAVNNLDSSIENPNSFNHNNIFRCLRSLAIQLLNFHTQAERIRQAGTRARGIFG